MAAAVSSAKAAADLLKVSSNPFGVLLDWNGPGLSVDARIRRDMGGHPYD